MYKLVVDCMGGDNGSPIVIDAIKRFLSEFDDCQIIAVGKKEELTALEGICEIRDARGVIPMTAGALDVLRAKDSSMLIALNILKNENCDGIISCGSTGGFLAASTITLRLIPGIKRAALCTCFPCQRKGRFLTILDCGANNEVNGDELVQFALMGRIFCQTTLGTKEPNVYLLSNGSEDEKGAPEVKEANKKLREINFPGFKGNIEGRECILDDSVDVVVTGGFAGNCFIKGVEGTAKFMGKLIKNAFKMNIFTKIGYLFARKGVKEISKTMDYKEVGGAMLVGVNNAVVKAHGNSDPKGFFSAMKILRRMVINRMVDSIKEGVKADEGNK